MDEPYQRYLTCPVMCKGSMFEAVYMATAGNKSETQLIPVHMAGMF
jgi:hypothetical protein